MQIVKLHLHQLIKTLLLLVNRKRKVSYQVSIVK